MKPLLLILALALPVSAQSIKELEQIKDWKFIQEMSGPIPDHPGLTMEIYAAQIARGGDIIKAAFRVDFPGGAPVEPFRPNLPHGFDISSISRMMGKLELNCKTLTVRPFGKEGYFYQFNGRRHKTKEPSFQISSGNILARYFCEDGSTPAKAPTLKPSP